MTYGDKIFPALVLLAGAASLFQLSKRIDTLEMTQPLNSSVPPFIHNFQYPNGSWIHTAMSPREDPMDFAERIRDLMMSDPGEGARSENVKYKEDTWTDVNGFVHVGSLHRGAQETLEDFCERFDAVIAALKLLFPPA